GIPTAAAVSEYRVSRSSLLCSRTLPVPWSSTVQSSVSLVWALGCLQSLSHPLYCLQSLVISCTVCILWSSSVLSAFSGHPLYCLHSLVISCTVRSLRSSPVLSAVSWSSPVLCTVSGHPLYCPQSLGHHLYCPQSLVISSSLSAVSWSSPVLCPQSLGYPLYCPQSLVIPCTIRSLWSSPVLSAVSGHPL
ncbi:unnamed protein product, partial [Staurois parvus]